MLDHLRVAITVFRSEITDVSGSASGIEFYHAKDFLSAHFESVNLDLINKCNIRHYLVCFL